MYTCTYTCSYIYLCCVSDCSKRYFFKASFLITCHLLTKGFLLLLTDFLRSHTNFLPVYCSSTHRYAVYRYRALPSECTLLHVCTRKSALWLLDNCKQIIVIIIYTLCSLVTIVFPPTPHSTPTKASFAVIIIIFHWINVTLVVVFFLYWTDICMYSVFPT